MNNEDYVGSDILDSKDLDALDKNHEDILDGLYKKVRDSESAKEWLNTSLGTAFRKFLAADKMRSMKVCSTELDLEKHKEAQIDYAAICKLELLFGSIISDGHEAFNQLNQLNKEDSHGT